MEMKKIDMFTNQYSLSKTLQFKLIPVGKTEDFFRSKKMLEEDKERAENYTKMKGYMDEYHKDFIERVLNKFHFKNDKYSISEYAELFYKSNKTDADIKNMTEMEKCFRKEISAALKGDAEYKNLFKKEFIREILPKYLTNEDDLEVVKQFKDFTTYFTGFWQNRENMYTQEEQSTGIAYRCINDNLPKFLNNIKAFERISAVLSDKIDILNKDMSGLYQFEVKDLFTYSFFEFVLSQSGIDMYNQFIGGYSNSDETKTQGLNEYINLYNQQIAKTDKTLRLPKLVPLYKQILSDKGTISFLPEKFKDDSEVIKSIYDFCCKLKEQDTINNISNLFEKLSGYDYNGIFVTAGLPITSISKGAFNNWNLVSENWCEEYKSINPVKKKNLEKYAEEMKAAYKKIKSMSLADIEKYGIEGKLIPYISDTINKHKDAIHKAYNSAESFLTSDYPEDKKLVSDEDSIKLIKDLLDQLKELEKTMKMFCGTGKESDRDMLFYGQFTPLYEEIYSMDKLYDKVRNYLTQKPYSKDKIKLNFQNSQLLGGWDKNKERDYRTTILCKDGLFYLAIINKYDTKILQDDIIKNHKTAPCYRKMEYKLLPGPNKMLPKVFFAKSNIDYYSPSEEILRIRIDETFKKGEKFSLDDCHKLIDFFKASINKHPDWNKFGFEFSDTSSYADISQFYREVANQGFNITYTDVSEEYITQLIDEGKLFLFQIYNKDFSPYSHGTPNLHTLYFKELFEEENLADVVYKLDGGAEMFYREASIKKQPIPTHPANVSIKNKNQNNPKKESVFQYDLIKDNRFTERQFSLHLPITLNFKANGNEYINPLVRQALRKSDSNYVIGIDRGERNLLYVCVIDDNENIVYQRSLNEIVYKNEKNNAVYKVDYQKLLDNKEKDREDARKNWKSIENIKELKEGYLSAVVNEICKLVVKYDAVVVMENLNRGFKTGRFKVEKQVYQKFENMLINKLNYLVDKNLPHNEKGGLLNAYQLTNKADKIDNATQNGFIFYIPAYLTSKIDPTTGFADLIHPRYKSVDKSLEFFSKIDSISYLEDENMFAFKINYDKFERCSISAKKDWTVYSNGKRIKTFRNPEKNNEWDNCVIVLTEEFKKLFDEYKIDITTDIKQQILNQKEADFFKKILKLMELTLQMRNSITGDTETDYLISPVKNSDGKFYCSDDYNYQNSPLPSNADANGAYNIARKGLWAINKIRNASEDEYVKTSISIKNDEWLKYAQKL